MTLTGHELTAGTSILSAIVAVAGIWFGYRSAKSANDNALKLAREERATRRQDEFKDLKRVVYAKYLTSLNDVHRTHMRASGIAVGTPERLAALHESLAATVTAANLSTELHLLAPLAIRQLQTEALNSATKVQQDSGQEFVRSMAKIGATMRDDLNDEKFSTPDELDTMIEIALAKQSSAIDKPPDQNTVS